MLLPDPCFTDQSRIDVLLGTSIYAEIIESEIIKGQTFQPIAISSRLGWLFTGNVSNNTQSDMSKPLTLHCAQDCTQHAQLFELVQDFWRAEERLSKKSYLLEEQDCENFYNSTTRRDEAGRYIIKLPWKTPESLQQFQLEKSYTAALRALHRLENHFIKNEKLRLAYTEFINEYVTLGYMKLVSKVDKLKCNPPPFYSIMVFGRRLALRQSYARCSTVRAKHLQAYL